MEILKNKVGKVSTTLYAYIPTHNTYRYTAMFIWSVDCLGKDVISHLWGYIYILLCRDLQLCGGLPPVGGPGAWLAPSQGPKAF